MKIEIVDSKLAAIVGRIIKRQGKKLQHIKMGRLLDEVRTYLLQDG